MLSQQEVSAPCGLELRFPHDWSRHLPVFPLAAHASAHIFRASDGCPARGAPGGAVVPQASLQIGAGRLAGSGGLGAGVGGRPGEGLGVWTSPCPGDPLVLYDVSLTGVTQVTLAPCGSGCASLSSVHTLHRGDQGPTLWPDPAQGRRDSSFPNFLM